MSKSPLTLMVFAALIFASCQGGKLFEDVKFLTRQGEPEATSDALTSEEKSSDAEGESVNTPTDSGSETPSDQATEDEKTDLPPSTSENPPLERCSGKEPSEWTFKAGKAYFGRNKYIEYIPGKLPVIISAPHGGYLTPKEIPAQDGAVRDGGSQEYTRLVADELERLTGERPHVIINNLTRNRLQANSEKAKAAFGNAHAEKAWDEYHDFINHAKSWVTSACGRGHYFDFHTNGHDERWVEIAFALDKADLNKSDAALNAAKYREKSTLRHLVSQPEAPFIEILRGPKSIGGLLNAAGVKVVPSPKYPGPGKGSYFNGGYNVRRHGSLAGGVIDGTQIESHFAYVNSGEKTRASYSKKLAAAVRTFMQTFYGFAMTRE